MRAIDGEYLAKMEDVLELYAQPSNPAPPQLCIDERPCQLLDDVLAPHNLNTHTAGAFYQALNAPTARRLVRRLEMHYTPIPVGMPTRYNEQSRDAGRSDDMATMLELPLSMTEQELGEVKQDLAVVLYQRRAISLAKGAEIAGLTRLDFQRLLAKRGIPLHIMMTDVEADLDTLRTLRKHSPIE